MSSFVRNFSLFMSGLIASYIVLSPTYRSTLLHLTDSESRHILGTLVLKADDNQYKVVKLRHNNHILVEIYTMAPSHQYDLVSSFQIPDSRDVFYDFRETLSNLFSANIDDDDDEEVVVPVLDENLVAHLNVIKFDKSTQTFQHFTF